MDKEISMAAMTVGSNVVKMHGHGTSYGLLQGWVVASRFEISKDVFAAMYAAMQSKNSLLTPHASGKMAYVVSANEDDTILDQVNSVVVIYAYDSTYHLAVLTPPVLKCFVVGINGKRVEPDPYEIDSPYRLTGANIFCQQKKIPNYNFNSYYTVSCNDTHYDVDPVGWSVLTVLERKARDNL